MQDKSGAICPNLTIRDHLGQYRTKWDSIGQIKTPSDQTGRIKNIQDKSGLILCGGGGVKKKLDAFE